MPRSIARRRKHIKGFFYLEVLVALLLVAVALVPAMDALQAGLQSSDIHQILVTQQYRRLSKMEQIQAVPFADLVAAAEVAGNKNNPTSYSDPSGTPNRNLVYLSLYDADADPFSLTDPNIDGDNNIYTGSTANLIWLRVETEGTSRGVETLLSR